MESEKEKSIQIHSAFRLDDTVHTLGSLKDLATQYLKTGAQYQKVIGSFILEWLNDEDFVKVYTSGSTGTPKVIKIRKEYMVSSAKATAAHFTLPEKTTALLCLPADYIAGKMMLVRALVLGWHIDLVAPQSNPLRDAVKHYDFCAMTPYQLEHSLSNLHVLSKLIVGGGAMSNHLRQKIVQFKTKIYETYGMTETVTHIAARRVNPKISDQPSAVFKALSNVLLEQDKRGCLVINAPAVSNGPVVTNDLVRLISDTEFVWLGRVDNVINSGGIKLYPEQIEHKLGALINVDFFVAGISDDVLGERVALFVEQTDAFSFTREDKLEEVLDTYEIPKSIYTLPCFVRTPNGKIQRRASINKALNP